MNPAERAARAADRFQRRHRWLAFTVAVWKKFGDDQAGNLAALITYNAFVAVFPTLMVLVTVLDLVLRDAPGVRSQIFSSALAHFPMIGQQLSAPHPLRETGPALVIGLVLAVLGARGVASAAQNAMNTVWAVPFARRPGFPWNQLRSAGIIAVAGVAVIVTSLLSGFAAGSLHSVGGPAANVAAIVIALLVNLGAFWLVFRLATAAEIAGRLLFPAAMLSAVCWQVLQLLGGLIVRHQLAHSSALYGSFAAVLGLVAWLYLQAQVTLYAVEAAVVRERKMWPRGLVRPPLTAEDREALVSYAETSQRLPEEHIDVHIDPAPGR